MDKKATILTEWKFVVHHNSIKFKVTRFLMTRSVYATK